MEFQFALNCETPPPWNFLVIGMVFVGVLGALVFAGIGALMIRPVYRNWAWEESLATITSSTSKHEFDGEKDYIETFVHYTYAVDGCKYSGKGTIRSNYGESALQQASKDSVSSKYSVGERITILVNPKNSSRSATDNIEALPAMPMLALGVGVLFFLCGSSSNPSPV